MHGLKSVAKRDDLRWLAGYQIVYYCVCHCVIVYGVHVYMGKDSMTNVYVMCISFEPGNLLLFKRCFQI